MRSLSGIHTTTPRKFDTGEFNPETWITKTARWTEEIQRAAISDQRNILFAKNNEFSWRFRVPDPDSPIFGARNDGIIYRVEGN